MTDHHHHIIYVTLSNMTSAAPLSVVLTLFSKRKDGKRGRRGASTVEVIFERVTKVTSKWINIFQMGSST